MDIQSFKWWQWAAVGLVAGLAVSAGRLLARGDEGGGGPGFISQAEFERDLRLPPVMGKTHLADITVYRGRDVDVVTMQRLVSETLDYQPCKLAAPRPYVPMTSAVSSQNPRESIGSYLGELAAGNSNLYVGYAWWDEPRWVVALWALVGVLVMGGLWPPVVRWLIGAGLGRPVREPEYDLDRFHHGPEAQVAAATPKDDHKLAELEEEMLKGLAGMETPAAAANPAPAAPPRPLAATADEPPAFPPADDEAREYEGEYYPVVRPHGTHHSAFTIIEMIVVIGVILILMSLLLPALTMAQRQAETTQCASNLRQLGIALQMYANSNHGWLPAWSGWHTYPPGLSDDSPGPAWTLELTPYLGPPDSKVYNCPSFLSKERRRNYFLAAQWSGRSGRHAMKLTDVTMSGRFVLSGDKTQRTLYPPSFGTNGHAQDDADPDDFGGGAPVLAWPWEQGGFYMHRGGNNVLFDDSHVSLFSRYEPRLMTFNPKRMQAWADVTPDVQPKQNGVP